MTEEAAPPQLPQQQYDLMYCMEQSIFNNRLIFIAVTSSAKGAIENEGFQFGQGKSNLAMGLSTMLTRMAIERFEQRIPEEEEVEEIVKENMGYCKADYIAMIKRGMNKRIVCYVADDMEVDFGKHRSHDNEFRELAYFSQTIRPQVAVVVGTMPDLGQIARAWRDLFLFEVKVPFRGYCEIQKLKRWTDFWDPLDVKLKLDYKGEQEFPEASARLKAWYEPWRIEKQKSILGDWITRYEPKEDKRKTEKPPPPPMDEVSRAASNMSRLRWQRAKARDNPEMSQGTIEI